MCGGGSGRNDDQFDWSVIRLNWLLIIHLAALLINGGGGVCGCV